MSRKDVSIEDQKDIVDGLYKTKGGIYCLFRKAQIRWVRAVFTDFGVDNISHFINKSDIDLNNCTLVKDDSEVLIMYGDKDISISELMGLSMMDLRDPELTVTDSKTSNIVEEGVYKIRNGFKLYKKFGDNIWIVVNFNLGTAPSDIHILPDNLVDNIEGELVSENDILIYYDGNTISLEELINMSVHDLAFSSLRIISASEKEESGTVSISDKYPKYFRNVSHLTVIDTYDVCNLFNVNDSSGATQHAIKKLLLSGTRNGGKSAEQDIQEAIVSLERRLAILRESQD